MPLGPRDGAFAGVGNCGSIFRGSSLLARAGDGVDVCGVELCTLMTGTDSTFLGAMAEPLLLLVADGGGDFKRGEIGHCGVVSPDPGPVLFVDRGNLETASVTEVVDCNCGTLAADKAR